MLGIFLRRREIEAFDDRFRDERREVTDQVFLTDLDRDDQVDGVAEATQDDGRIGLAVARDGGTSNDLECAIMDDRELLGKFRAHAKLSTDFRIASGSKERGHGRLFGEIPRVSARERLARVSLSIAKSGCDRWVGNRHR